MKKRWVILNKGADFIGLGQRFSVNPRIMRLIRNRDVIGTEAIDAYLNATIADLGDGMLMQDMDRAVEILQEKIAAKEKIRVIGDYDIDGVCATYILLEALDRLGAVTDSDIPDRVKDGYGLNRSLIERAAKDEIDTIITCDNGIAAYDEIAYARELGMTVIVTDHHEVPYEERGTGEEKVRSYRLPPADAVVDPKRWDCPYPFKELCGAAVAYKTMECLYEVMGLDSSELDDLLEEVGIATVGDVMELTGENRILVKQALEMLGSTKNKGLRSLIAVSKLAGKKITAYHIGFILGPCLNAGGRMDTAKRALALLRAKTNAEADRLAGNLKALNDSRKELTETAVGSAITQIEESVLKEDKVLVVYLPDCQESIAGIVASKIRERYYKPTFILTDGETCVKGSGRSIEAYSMYESLTEAKDHLLKFGGHRQAAGLSIAEEEIDVFRKILNDHCTLTEEDLSEKVTIDMELPFADITEELIEELSLLEPFGKGNRKPVFAVRNARILSARRIGKNQDMLKFIMQDSSGAKIEAIWYDDADLFLSDLEAKYGPEARREVLSGRAKDVRIHATFYPEINDYYDRKLQIVITNYM